MIINKVPHSLIKETYTPVIPLSTIVPGRVLPFCEAYCELVGQNLYISPNLGYLC